MMKTKEYLIFILFCFAFSGCSKSDDEGWSNDAIWPIDFSLLEGTWSLVDYSNEKIPWGNGTPEDYQNVSFVFSINDNNVSEDKLSAECNGTMVLNTKDGTYAQKPFVAFYNSQYAPGIYVGKQDSRGNFFMELFIRNLSERKMVALSMNRNMPWSIDEKARELRLRFEKISR